MLVIAVVLPAISISQAQKLQRDSLIKEAFSQTGEKKANTLIAIAKLYWYVNNDSAVFYAESAKQLADVSGKPNTMAEASRILAISKLNAFKNAVEIQPLLDNALLAFKELSDKKGIADTYNNLGSFYKYTNDKEKALAYYDSALVAYQQLSDNKGEAAVLNYVGIIYQNMGEFRKAIDFTLKGLVVREKTDDYLGIVYSYLNVGNIFLAGGQPEIAIRYYQQGIAYADKHGIHPPGMAYNMLGKSYLQVGDLDKAGDYLLPSKGNRNSNKIVLGNLFFAMGQLDSAAYYYQENRILAEKIGDKDALAQALNGLAKISLKNRDYSKAFDLSNKAHAFAIGSDKNILAESAGLLAQLYEVSKQPAMALHFMKEQHGLLDSMVNSGYQQKLAYFESKADLDKLESSMEALSVQKELQEKLYKQEKLLKNFLLAVSILILVTAFFVIRNINAKRSKIQSQNLLLDEQKHTVEKSYYELQSTQAQLIQAEKMASLGELTAGIAHEIQNPLNFVNNFSEVNKELLTEMKAELNKGNYDDANAIANDIIDNEEKINHHGKRADAIVKGMLQHSRSTTSVKEPTNINTLVDEYLRLSYHAYRSKDKDCNISLQAELDKSIPKIAVIPQDIGRVLLNLFNNAFYAVAQRERQVGDNFEPTVLVSTSMSGDKLVIIVKDNGNGIPGKLLDKIFQPFFTTKPTGQGTGLGLSLSYDIIKSHCGTLEVETREGEGAEFIIQLPVKSSS